MPGNPCQHSRADLIAIMEGEDVIGPIVAFEDSVRTTTVTLNVPADTK
jgi:hypothetical protein